MKYINDTKISKIGLGTGRFGTRVSEALPLICLTAFMKTEARL